MLNGIDPILIFNFKKLPTVASGVAKIPLISQIVEAVTLPAIPIYLSEKLTGIYIDSEDKNIDIDTTVTALSDGDAPDVSQRAIGSTVKISMVANRDSIGLALFSALSDLILPKVTSKEYSITYLHGAVTIFNGLLHSFSITQNANDTRSNITLELTKPAPDAKTPAVTVGRLKGATPL